MKIVKFISRDRLENSRFFLQTVCAYLNTQKDGLFCSLIPRTSSLFGGDPEKSRARGTRKKTLQRGLERNSSSPLASAFFFFSRLRQSKWRACLQAVYLFGYSSVHLLFGEPVHFRNFGKKSDLSLRSNFYMLIWYSIKFIHFIDLSISIVAQTSKYKDFGGTTTVFVT